jgi:hypothetical protein
MPLLGRNLSSIESLDEYGAALPPPYFTQQIHGTAGAVVSRTGGMFELLAGIRVKANAQLFYSYDSAALFQCQVLES